MSTGYTSNYPTSGYASETQLRNEFQKLQEALEDTISRTGQGLTEGQSNSMEYDLDLDGHNLFGVGVITAQELVLGGVDIFEAYRDNLAAIEAQTAIATFAADRAYERANDAADYASAAANQVTLAADQVALATQEVVRAASEADRSFSYVAQAKEHADEAEDTLAEFRNYYYGTSITEPTTRPDGSPIQLGDMYYDSNTDYLRVWSQDADLIPEWKFAGRGPQGLKGDKGDTGNPGAKGDRGDNGNHGRDGKDGVDGEKGDQGIEGPRGLQGPEGPQGVVGPQGPQGSIGPKGDIGLTGPQGPQGVVGPEGPQGEIGPKGDKGEQGIQGPQGVEGPVGPRGEKGEIGLQGPEGPQGHVGPEGPQGPLGLQGPQGVQGPKGDRGDDGDNFNITEFGTLAERDQYDDAPRGFVYYASDVQSIVDREPVYFNFPYDPSNRYYVPEYVPGQQSVIVSVNNILQTPDSYSLEVDVEETTQVHRYYLNLVAQPGDLIQLRSVDNSTSFGTVYFKVSSAHKDWGPAIPFGRGPQGFRGDAGIAGPQGIQGPRGPQGPQGEAGIDGQQGPQGPTGAKGEQGEQGPAGITGPQGPVGEQGARGERGPQGDIGPQGIQGPQGEVGPQGPRGEQGPEGDEGPRGLEGPQGPQGDRGDPGEQGPPGNPGKDGTNGTNGVDGKDGNDGNPGAPGGPGPKGDPAELTAPANNTDVYAVRNNQWVSLTNGNNSMVPQSRTITAGTGLSGGGALTANRTLTVKYGTTSGTAAQGNDSRITNAVPNSRTISTGTGLSGGGNLTANRTLSVDYGTTEGTAAQGNDSRIVNAVPNSREVGAGTGLSGGGNLTANRTLSVKYGTVAGTAAQGNDPRIAGALQRSELAESTGNSTTIAMSQKAVTDVVKASRLALGADAAATTLFTTAIGGDTSAEGPSSTVLGYKARATEDYATALGSYALSIGKHSTAIGPSAKAYGDLEVQIGLQEGPNRPNAVYSARAITVRSDQNDKSDIRDIDLGLDFIMQLRPVKFKYDHQSEYLPEIPDDFYEWSKEDQDAWHEDRANLLNNGLVEKDGTHKGFREQEGFLYQQVKAVADSMDTDFSGLVDATVNGGSKYANKSIAHEKFIAPMVKAIQEQQQMIEELQERLNRLEAKDS